VSPAPTFQAAPSGIVRQGKIPRLRPLIVALTGTVWMRILTYLRQEFHSMSQRAHLGVKCLFPTFRKIDQS
jgi:hypothetical protein